MPPKVLELFAGIGGLSCAWPESETIAAIDINRNARQVYTQNFPHSYLIREIASLSTRELSEFGADVWWLSPPCQPYSQRGTQRDLFDRRSTSLSHLIDAIECCRPESIALENVLGFVGSTALKELLRTCKQAGYHTKTIELCPSQMGWPNRRPRFYLLASQLPLPNWRELPQYHTTLSAFLLRENDADACHSLCLGMNESAKYESALDRVLAADPLAMTACFASSYGKTILHAGSYLQIDHRFRRFAPREVARLLGFPDDYKIGETENRTAWKLLGNSLSLLAVRYVISHLPTGPQSNLPWLPIHRIE